jgi:hypothetical protein
MRSKRFLAFAASFVLAAAFLAQEPGGSKAKAVVKAGIPVFMPPSDLK